MRNFSSTSHNTQVFSFYCIMDEYYKIPVYDTMQSAFVAVIESMETRLSDDVKLELEAIMQECYQYNESNLVFKHFEMFRHHCYETLIDAIDDNFFTSFSPSEYTCLLELAYFFLPFLTDKAIEVTTIADRVFTYCNCNTGSTVNVIWLNHS